MKNKKGESMSKKIKKILVIILLICALYVAGMSTAIILFGIDLYGVSSGKPIHYILLIISIVVITLCSLLIEKLFRKK